MKILLVNGHGADLAYGGAERYVHDLREGLERRGDRCAVLSAFPVHADTSAELRVLHATDWRDHPMRRMGSHLGDWVAAPTPALTAQLRELAPDLLHTSNLYGITTGIWECARRLGIPVVHTLHDYGLLCPRTTLLRRDGALCRPHPLLCGLRTRRLARWASALGAVIGVSAHVLAAHAEVLRPETPAEVILPPLAATMGAGCSPVPAPGPHLRTLGFTGALSAHKGVAMLLAAAPGLAAAGIQLRIAGGGPMESEVASVPGVEYAGRLVGAELGEFIARCDAGVVPSLWEEPGLTFSALEWLGAGRPVLATGRGGLAELPSGGVERLSGDPEDLVAHATALADPQRFAVLRAEVPATDGERDRERWVRSHQNIYARAGCHSAPRADP